MQHVNSEQLKTVCLFMGALYFSPIRNCSHYNQPEKCCFSLFGRDFSMLFLKMTLIMRGIAITF